MRRTIVFVGPLLAAAFAFACEDDPSSNPGTQFPEAGAFDSSPPDYDGAVPPQNDAAPDVVDTPKPATVLVTGARGPQSGVTVVFHDALGAVVATKQTGADGKASQLPAPAMATVVFDLEFRKELFTVTGIQPGDELPVVAPLNGTLATYGITLPGQFTGDDGPSANYYAEVGGCTQYTGDPDSPITLYLEGYCWRGTGFGAVLVQGSNQNDAVVAHSFKKPAAMLTDGGALAVTTDAWVSPPSSVTVSVTNTTNMTGIARLSQIAGLDVFDARGNGAMGDAYQATFETVGGAFADANQATVSFDDPDSPSRLSLASRGAPGGTIAFDGTRLLPGITAAEVDATSPKRPKATWTGSMAQAKGGYVRITRFDNQTETRIDWTLVVPPNAGATGSVTAPALPASLDGLFPTSDAGNTNWLATPEVVFVDSELLPDYAAFRKIDGVLLSPQLLGAMAPESATLPKNGTFRMTHYVLLID